MNVFSSAALRMLGVLMLAAVPTTGLAVQIVLFEDNFNTSQGSDFTTGGVIGTSGWQVNRSGDDWGARIHNNILSLTNTASAATNQVGWVSVTRSNAGFGGGFSPTLGDNPNLVEWFFNLRQIRPNPGGFDGNAYAVAFVLATNSATGLGTTGQGYAVVLGNQLTPDPVRLVRFDSGFSNDASLTDLIVAPGGTGLEDPATSYMSLRVIYDPDTDQWALYGRNDGTSAFADPRAGTLTALGSVIDNTYTNQSLANLGVYWQGSTATNQTAFFDNVTVLLTPEPGRAVLLALAAMLVLGRRSRQGAAGNWWLGATSSENQQPSGARQTAEGSLEGETGEPRQSSISGM